MAKSKSSSCNIHLILFLSAVAAIVVAASAQLEAYSPESEMTNVGEGAWAPEAVAEDIRYLQECASKVTEECGKEMFTSMFTDSTVTKDCCGLVVAMGKPCHMALASSVILKIPEYKSNASFAFTKGMQSWENCVNPLGSN